MCYGPVKVRWRSGKYKDGDNETEIIAGEHLDENIAILFSLDLVKINKKRPNVADFDDFDFYFIAQRDLKNVDAVISIWFPFPSEDVEYGWDNLGRKNSNLKWQRPAFLSALRSRTQDTNLSFGWDEGEIRKVLPIDQNTNIRDDLEGRLAELIDQEAFAHGLDIDIRSAPFIQGGQEAGQHFEVNISGSIKAGDVFHVWFRIIDASAGAGDIPLPCSAKSVFFYYDNDDLSNEYDQHPYINDPLVPLIMLQIGMLFPVRLRAPRPPFESFRTIITPTDLTDPEGQVYDDGFWWVFFNAHTPKNATFKEKFKFSWVTEHCMDTENRHKFVLNQLRANLTGADLVAFVRHFLRSTNYSISLVSQEPASTIQPDIVAYREELNLDLFVWIFDGISEEITSEDIEQRLSSSGRKAHHAFFTLGKFGNDVQQIADERTRITLIDGTRIATILTRDDIYYSLDNVYQEMFPVTASPSSN